MRKTAKFGMSLFSAAVLACVSVPASAELLSTSANSYNFSWSYNSNTAAGLLGGSGVMTASGFNTSTLSLNITLTNSSTVEGQGGDRLVSFGFGINPDASLRSIVFGDDGSDGGMIAAGGASGALPANVPGVEICAYGGNNCPGGSNGGIYSGNSDQFTISMGRVGGAVWGSSVDINPVGFKYQTGSGSFEFSLAQASLGLVFDGNEPSNEVVEPYSLGLIGVGFLAFGPRRRRSGA